MYVNQWGRNIDVGDQLDIPLEQLRAGGDRQEVELDGAFSFDFTASWVDMTRVLTLRALRAIKALTTVTLSVTAASGLRLPVKQGGVAVALKDQVLMDITKARVLKDKQAYHEMRPETGRSSQSGSHVDSRPGTRQSRLGANSRPLTRGSQASSRVHIL